MGWLYVLCNVSFVGVVLNFESPFQKHQTFTFKSKTEMLQSNGLIRIWV